MRKLFLILTLCCGCAAPRPHVVARVVAECPAGNPDYAMVRAEAVAEWRP